MQNMLLEYLEAGFKPKLHFCKAFLAQLKTLDYRTLNRNNELQFNLLEDLTFYARRLECENHVLQSSLLDEVGRCVSKQADFFGWKEGERDFLGFLTWRGLNLYITETLRARTSLTQSDRSCILGVILERRYDQPDGGMVDVLLEHGAQPNEKYKGSTVWGCFLSLIATSMLLYNENDILPIIESLLSHGANLQQRIVTGQETRTREMSGRAADLHKRQEVNVDIVKSAQEILLKLFGEEKISEMLKKIRKDQKSNPSRLRWWSRQSLQASMKTLKRRNVSR